MLEIYLALVTYVTQIQLGKDRDDGQVNGRVAGPGHKAKLRDRV